MKPVNFNEIKEFTLITLMSNPAMYTDLRIDRDTVPEGYHAYDIREKDDGSGDPACVESGIVKVNHMGTAILPCELDFKGEDYIRIRRNNAEDFNFTCWFPGLGSDTPGHVTFSEFDKLVSENMKDAEKSDCAEEEIGL